MKFTNGFWQTADGITPLYAVEYADSRVNGSELTVYAPGKHITSRGDCLNLGILTVKLTSPMEDVIKVSITHFEGKQYPGPFVQIADTNPNVTIEESEDSIIYKTGNTRAVIDKRPDSWGIRFYDGERADQYGLPQYGSHDKRKKS